MATYKVIQDIEAEDKLIGWMTPRQTIYAAIVIVSAFLWFMFATHGFWWLGIIFLPHMILLSVLSGPFVHDQPSEVWLLARIQFFLKPRRRIWDQSGIKELVTITVPKKIERRLTDGLSQGEVKSRLSALANTLDSRGWAVKNVNVNMYGQIGYANADSDRLISTNAFPQEVPSYDVTPQDDMLDAYTNPVAQHLEQMISQSTQAHRQQILQKMSDPQDQQQAGGWFLDPTATTQQATTQAAAPKPHVPKKNVAPKAAKQVKQPVDTPTPMANPVVQQLAQNNDLNVATIARQANKATTQADADGEVVISLR